MEADADDTQIVVRGAAIVGGVSIGITLGCTLLPGYGIDGGLGVKKVWDLGPLVASVSVSAPVSEPDASKL